MIAATIGMLVGRLILSYVLVWIVTFFISKFNFKGTFYRVHSLMGMTAVSLVFIIPFMASMAERV